MKKELELINLSGEAINPYINDLAQLRIKLFYEFPYLYQGSMEYEKKYLSTYLNPNAVMMVVLDNGKVVGVTTGMPLKDEADYVKEPFIKAGYDIDEIFYFGESLLLPEYRGQGIGRKFFQAREAAAKKQGCTIATFCVVVRPDNHPLRPADWFPLDSFWESQGYKKHPEVTTEYIWKERGEESETGKPMVFWMKKL